MMYLYYPETADDWHPDGVEIELHDHVTLSLPTEPCLCIPEGGKAYWSDEIEFEGQITKVYPIKGEVRVRYQDHENPRRDGEPITRSVRVSVDQVEFEGRDG